MKSDSSNSSAESEASGLVLRVINPKMLNYKGSSEECVAITATSYKEPPLVVSGQTTSTHMPVKSTAKISATVHNLQPRNPTRPSLLKNPGAGGSGHLTKQEETFCLDPANMQAVEFGTRQASSEKETSETSPQARYLTMTSLQEDFPARVFPLLEGVKVFKTSQGELFSSRSAVSLEIKDQATYCLRMLKDYFLTTTADLSQLYCFHWMNLGTMSNGRCSTLNIGCPRTAKGSLSSVLEEKVDEKYYLSKKMIDFLIKNNTNEFDGRFKFKGALSENDISFSLTARYWKMGKTDPYIKDKEIRRLTPTECERLQGFPDNWTDGVSDTQRYKQMGNAVSVPVIKAIRKSLMRIFENRESQIT